MKHPVRMVNIVLALLPLATASGNVLTVKKNTAESLVYLDFSNMAATSFTVDDGVTQQTYSPEGKDTYTIKLHSDCTVTVDGSADVAYKEVLRDYEALIPAAYADDSEQLHFNLWLTTSFELSESLHDIQ